MLDILVVNRRLIEYTKQVVMDLEHNKDYKLTIVDNGSDADIYNQLLKFVVGKDIAVKRNDNNRPLNHIWNSFASESKYKYVCMLNNDVRIANNFVEHTLLTFEDPSVAISSHVTNNAAYKTVSKDVKYTTSCGMFRQGWDFSVRTNVYPQIPTQLEFFCGDEYIFQTLYERQYKMAMIYSSPIIHYQGATSEPGRGAFSNNDINAFKKLGHTIKLRIHDDCKLKPEFNVFI